MKSILCSTTGVLCAALLLCAAPGCTDKHPAPVATPPPLVQVATPVERLVASYAVYTARTQAVQSVDVKARVTGYLTKICFKDGDDVKEGSVLFEIDNRPYKAALDKAKADLQFAKASLEKTQAEYDIGLAVRKERREAISEQELDKRKGMRDESAAQVKQADAVRERCQLYFDWCRVTAPIGGRANRHFIDVGNLVSEDATLLTNIVSLKPIWAYYDVDETMFQRVQKLIAEGKYKSARTGKVPVDFGLGIGTEFPIKGVVDFVSNQLDPNTGSFRVRAVFANEDEMILGGMFGRVRVMVDEPHSGLLVADEAVGTNQGQKFVYVVNGADEVEYRPVDVGQVHDGLREVMRMRRLVEPGPKGDDVVKEVEVLKSSDRVIVNGLQRVRPGDKVDPQSVDMLTMLALSGGRHK